MIAFITFECGGGGEKAHQFHLLTHPLLRPESIAGKEEECIIRLIFLQSTTDCAGALKEEKMPMPRVLDLRRPVHGLQYRHELVKIGRREGRVRPPALRILAGGGRRQPLKFSAR